MQCNQKFGFEIAKNAKKQMNLLGQFEMAKFDPLLATLINNKKAFLHNYLFSSSNALGGRPLFGMTFLSLDSVEVVLNTSTKDRIHTRKSVSILLSGWLAKVGEYKCYSKMIMMD